MPRSHGFQERFQSCLPRNGRPDRDHLRGLAAQMRRNPERLTEGEDADGHDDDVDAVAELGDAEGQPRLTADGVDADDADGQTDHQRG